MTFTIKLKNSTHSLSLGNQLGEGATARVHEIQGTDTHVFKEYLTDSAARKAYAQQMQQKVEHFIDNAPPDDLIEDTSLGETLYLLAWPKQPVFKGKKFAGFVMPKIDFGKTVQLNRLFSIKNRKKFNFTEDIVWRLLVARNLANIYSELHKLGYYVIDTKPANLRTYKQAQGVCILDCDGFKLEGSQYQGEMITRDYIAPENIGASAKDMGKEQDLYALAIIIFQLFNNGIHPFSGKLNDNQANLDLQERIKKGAYAYGVTPSRIQEPSPWSLHHLFPNKLASMFERVFKKGERPEASEWVVLLDSLNDGRTLSKCPKGLHGKTFKKGCGACELDKLVGDAGLVHASKKQQPSNSDASGPWGKAPQPPPPRPAQKSSGGKGLLWIGGFVAAMIFVAFASNDKVPNSTSTVSSQTNSSQTKDACILEEKNCSIVELCKYASEGSGSTKKWNKNFPDHERLAKNRGLTCGVATNSTATVAEAKTCSSHPEICSDSKLCWQATKSKNGKKVWDYNWPSHVSYAQQRGKKCGVYSSTSSSSNGRVYLTGGRWTPVKDKCISNNSINGSPFSKISLATFKGGELNLLIYTRNSWPKSTQGKITFEANIGEPFVEVYQYQSVNKYIKINVSPFEALFTRAKWVDMTFPSGEKYRLSLSGSAAALADLRRGGCL